MNTTTQAELATATKTIFKCSKNELKTDGEYVYLKKEGEDEEPKENQKFLLVQETEKEIIRLRKLTSYLKYQVEGGLITEIRMVSPFNISVNFSHPNSPLTANLRVIAGKLHINGMVIYRKTFAKAFLENYIISNSQQEEGLL